MDAPAPPAEQIRERKGRVPLPLARQENQRRQGRLRFLEAHVDLPAETSMPARSAARPYFPPDGVESSSHRPA